MVRRWPRKVARTPASMLALAPIRLADDELLAGLRRGEVLVALPEHRACVHDSGPQFNLIFKFRILNPITLSSSLDMQYVALHDHCNAADSASWRIKPKLHLFLHITSDSSIPRLTWTYRDEDFGGSVARMARRRGNLLNCKSTSESVLTRFKLANPCVRIQ